MAHFEGPFSVQPENVHIQGGTEKRTPVPESGVTNGVSKMTIFMDFTQNLTF